LLSLLPEELEDVVEEVMFPSSDPAGMVVEVAMGVMVGAGRRTGILDRSGKLGVGESGRLGMGEDSASFSIVTPGWSLGSSAGLTEGRLRALGGGFAALAPFPDTTGVSYSAPK
jgi:hypothetical protein